MTTIHQVFTIRSFRSAKDRDFIKALQIYDANTHPQVKTDSREIAHWLEQVTFPTGKFYVCGLFVSGALVGFVEFVHLAAERIIHFDYFILDSERRSAGAFYTFTDQMRAFFIEEKLEWDFISAEVAHLDEINGVSSYAQKLIRLFRRIGFCEVLVQYHQPLLGLEHKDTSVKTTLLILPRVEMYSLSRSRFLEIVSAIYYKYYGEWYSIYSDTIAQYRASLDRLFSELKGRIEDKSEISLKVPEKDFGDSILPKNPPLQGVAAYLLKILASAIAAAAFHILLRHYMQVPIAWMIGVPASIFILLVVTVSLTDKKRFEAFKLLVSLISKFFDR
jgi:hypothetical protein